MLAVLGGVAGIVLAFAGTRVILYLAFQNEHVPIHATPSLPVLGFASRRLGVDRHSFWRWPGLDDCEGKSGGSAARRQPLDRRSKGWGQKSLVVLQAALSLVLLCAAGLLTRSLSNMQHQNFGFDTANRYILHIDPQMAGYKPEQLEALYRQLHENLAAIPGVKQVSFSLYSPMEGDNWGEGVFIEGEPPPPPGTHDHGASWLRASPHYFETIGTKIVEGRAITSRTRQRRAMSPWSIASLRRNTSKTATRSESISATT